MDYNSILQRFVLKYFFREALKRIGKRGSYDGEGIFIAFYSKYPGVKLPSFIRPDEEGKVGIILQYEFSNLSVYDDEFEVDLRFKLDNFRICIPYKSICTFLDRENQFCLQLSGSEEEMFFEEEEDEEYSEDTEEDDENEEDEIIDEEIENSDKDFEKSENVIYVKFKNEDE